MLTIISNTHGADAATHAHLVGIELLIRKDCLFITHLFPEKPWLRKRTTLSLDSSGRGIYELRADMKPEGDDAAELSEGLVPLHAGGARHGCKTIGKRKLLKSKHCN